MCKNPRDRERTRRALDQATDALERFILVFLASVAVLVLVVAVLMISTMGDDSSDLASRLYVAVAALLILGAVDTQFERVLSRSRRYSLTGPTRYDRSPLVRLLLLGVAAVVLFGCALLLP